MGSTAGTTTDDLRVPASGSDPTGSITISVDDRGQLSSIDIEAIPDQLRAAPEFARAVQTAYAVALAAGLPSVPGPHHDPREPGPVTVAPARRGPLDDIMTSGRTFVRAERISQRRIGGEVGVSDNDCVRVVLDHSGPTGDLAVDPGWLSNAKAANVAAAIHEAFQAAYRERESR